MSSFEPNLNILPTAQLKLWNELVNTPSNFILYGGTALALRLGHRESIDFDFFSAESFDSELLYREIKYLHNAEILQKSSNTLTCAVGRDSKVLVSFFGGLQIKQIMPPSVSVDNNLKIASLYDLAGTKAAVIQKRAEKKDYLDLYALLTTGNLSLETILSCAATIYETEFNPYITLKAMSYFKEQELQSLPEEIKQTFFSMVNKFNIDLIPILPSFNLGTLEQL